MSTPLTTASPSASPPIFCPRCGSSRVQAQRTPAGHQHHAGAHCHSCGVVWWLPRPMTPERAGAFVMPFGKHKGRTLAQIADLPDGRGYLRWLTDQPDMRPGIRRAATALLEALEPTP